MRINIIALSVKSVIKTVKGFPVFVLLHVNHTQIVEARHVMRIHLQHFCVQSLGLIKLPFVLPFEGLRIAHINLISVKSALSCSLTFHPARLYAGCGLRRPMRRRLWTSTLPVFRRFLSISSSIAASGVLFTCFSAEG